MKKLLFSVATLATVLLSAQVLESDTFESYTLGNVGTDTTGATPGKGGFYTLFGGNSDYQIVTADATRGKVLQIISGADDTTTGTTNSVRLAAKLNLNTAWNARTAGNNIMGVKLQLNPGPIVGRGAGFMRSIVSDATTSIVGVFYDYATSTLKGLAYLNNNGTFGLFQFTLGAATYPANNWSNIGYSYNFTTGAISWSTPEGVYSFSNAANIVPAKTPTEHDFIFVPGTGNNVAHTSFFNDYTINAQSTAVLAIKEAKIDGLVLRIYPNPTSDFVMIESKFKVNSVEIYDISGKKTNINKVNSNKVDVRSLTPGMYIIKMKTDIGEISDKFIKK